MGLVGKRPHARVGRGDWGSTALAGDRRSFAGVLAMALILPLGLAACGRKGPLDPPPSAAIPAEPASRPAPTTFIDPTTPTGGPQQAAPVAPVQTTQAAPATRPAKTQPALKSFFLDPLVQ